MRRWMRYARRMAHGADVRGLPEGLRKGGDIVDDTMPTGTAAIFHLDGPTPGHRTATSMTDIDPRPRENSHD
jgi:hypothetical protein